MRTNNFRGGQFQGEYISVPQEPVAWLVGRRIGGSDKWAMWEWFPGGDWNWRTFTFIHAEFEAQDYTGGWEVSLGLLGVGLSLRRWRNVNALAEAEARRTRALLS